MSYIQQFFTSRDNNADGATFVGQQGRLWWNPDTNQIYSSDGSTPGGIPLAGGGGGNGTPGGINGQVQFNQAGTFGGTANLTINSATGALSAVSFVGNGAPLTSITGANVTGTVADATHAGVADSANSVAGGNVTGTVANATHAAVADSANSVAGGNVSGAVANATYATSAGSATTAGTVTTNAQPNITSVGTLTSVSVSGNVQGGNLRTTGVVSALGGIVSSGEIYSATAVTGGNVSGATLFATGNVTGGNILTNGIVSAAGNVTGNYYIGNGSLLTGIISSYGNANVVANLAALGTNPVSTTGNVTAGNIVGTHVGNLTGTTVSVTGNITGGNINTDGLVTATGNITGGNVTTLGTANVGTLITGGAANNYTQITGGAAGNVVEVKALGTDANVSIAVETKGTGAIDLAPGSRGINISNGGTVTALTRTAGGSAYTTFPSVAITAPTTAGGVQATASVTRMFNSTATIAGGGTGYTVGDTLTVVGGTPFSTTATYTVATVSAGVITSVTAVSQAYTVLPSNPVSVTGGTGTGATLNLTWAVDPNGLSITSAGSGYVEQPTVSFSGGGGSGATAYATVGSGATIKWLGGTNNIQNASGNVLQFQDGGSATPNPLVIKNGSSPQLFPATNNTDLYLSSAGTGSLRFYTNTVAQTQMLVTHTANAVNYLQVTGATTSNSPQILFTGSDAGVGGAIITKSNGATSFFNNGTNSSRQFRVGATGVTTAVNYINVDGSVANSAPSFQALGTDANIDIAVTPKGSGNVTTTANVSVTGNITGGNLRTGGLITATGNITGGNVTTTGAVYSNYNTNTANTGSFMATGGNTKGGTGYLDFLVAQNTSGGATNPYKWLRTNSTGALEIINSAYTTNLFSLTDAGSLSIPGPFSISGKQAVNGPAFSAYAAAILQTIPNGTLTKVLFQTEEFDTNSNYASSTFTPTVEGYYQLNAEVRLDGASGTGEMMIMLYKNGAGYKRGTNQQGTQIAANFWAMQVSTVVYANGTTDYFEIYVQQGSGGSVSVTAVNSPAITWFNGCMLRGA
jgi:hypothetical protein